METYTWLHLDLHPVQAPNCLAAISSHPFYLSIHLLFFLFKLILNSIFYDIILIGKLSETINFKLELWR